MWWWLLVLMFLLGACPVEEAWTLSSLDPHAEHRSLNIDSKEGEEIAAYLNQRRAKLVEGVKRFNLKWASEMYKTEWNDKLASVAKSKLRALRMNGRRTSRLLFVRLPHMKKELDIAKEIIKYYWYELVTRGIRCGERRCERKRVVVGGRMLDLPFEMAFSKAAKIGCAFDYWKDSRSVHEAGKSKRLFRGVMYCVSYPRFTRILYNVGKPCTECEHGHLCDKMRGLCMTHGFVKRHPTAIGPKQTIASGRGTSVLLDGGRRRYRGERILGDHSHRHLDDSLGDWDTHSLP